MEDEILACSKGKTGNKVIQKNQANPNNESKSCNKHKWGQGKPGPPNDKEKLMNKELLVKKVT